MPSVIILTISSRFKEIPIHDLFLEESMLSYSYPSTLNIIMYITTCISQSSISPVVGNNAPFQCQFNKQ